MGDLSNAAALSFTTDAWSSRDGAHTLLSVTSHFIKDGKPFFVVLAAKPIKGILIFYNNLDFKSRFYIGKHNAHNMKQLIESVLNEFEIPREKIFMFLRDAAEVMIKIFEEAGFKSIDCFAHKLNLVSQMWIQFILIC